MINFNNYLLKPFALNAQIFEPNAQVFPNFSHQTRKFLRKSVKFSHQMRKFFDKTFENIRKRLKIFKNIRKHSKIFKNVRVFDYVFCTPLRV